VGSDAVMEAAVREALPFLFFIAVIGLMARFTRPRE